MRTLTQIPNTRGVIAQAQNYREYQSPNAFDFCLVDDAEYVAEVIAGKGLNTVCCPKGRKPYTNKPWIAMPALGRRFKPIGVLATPDLSIPANLNTPFTVLTWTCPLAFDAVITDVVCTFQGTGFVEGSGDLTWRFLVDSNYYLKDLGAVITTLGSLVYPSPVPRGGWRVYSENVLKVQVEFGTNSPGHLDPNGKVVVSLSGWSWPR